MKAHKLFNLIRWKNLFMIFLIQVLIKFILFPKLGATVFLDTFYFSILTLSTILIAAAGYVINDIYDIAADKINKPTKVFIDKIISKERAFKLYFILNIIGVLLGFWISNYIGKISFSIIFIITSFLLYQYAINLKKKLIIGNVLVSLLVFLSIIIVPIFDLIPTVYSLNQENQLYIFSITSQIAFFAFMLTLLREVVKDIEDVKGDNIINSNTLPIFYGVKTSKDIIFYLTLICVALIIYFASSYYEKNLNFFLYIFFLVVFPLLYFATKIRKSTNKNEIHKLSLFLKYIMLTGIFSIFLL